MAPKKLKTFPDIKPKTETIFPDIKLKTGTIFPNIKLKSETFFPDIKPKTEIFLPEIEPAIKSFLIDEPLPDFKKCDYWLDNWLNNLLNDNADCQTGIFVDNNYQSWADDDNKPDMKTDVFLPAVDDNVDGQTKFLLMIIISPGLTMFQI